MSVAQRLPRAHLNKSQNQIMKGCNLFLCFSLQRLKLVYSLLMVLKGMVCVHCNMHVGRKGQGILYGRVSQSCTNAEENEVSVKYSISQLWCALKCAHTIVQTRSMII